MAFPLARPVANVHGRRGGAKGARLHCRRRLPAPGALSGRDRPEVPAAQGPPAARGRARIRQGRTPAPASPATAASAPARLRPAIVAVSAPLADAHATFRRWLGEKYDTGVLDAVASAAAAERLGGDPLWLMVISGSGNAKTETVQSLSGAGALIVSTISSEGALLSATARSHGATGGLLHKLGSRGLLVFKDFTSILAMDRNARGTVLAALARNS